MLDLASEGGKYRTLKKRSLPPPASPFCAKEFDAVERFEPSPPAPAWGATLREGGGPGRNGNDDRGLRRCVRAKLATIRNLAVDV
jgi:hypothetical protein